MKTQLIGTLVMLTLLSLNAYAGRGQKQQKRIQQGVQSGELNQKEAARLQAQQNRIEENKKEALSDGNLSEEEKKRLHHQRNKASQNIYRQKHDDQKQLAPEGDSNSVPAAGN